MQHMKNKETVLHFWNWNWTFWFGNAIEKSDYYKSS